MNKQLLRMSGADVVSSRKKLKKSLGGSIHSPPPPTTSLYVRGLRMTDKGEKITKIKRKYNKSTTKQSSLMKYIVL